MFDLAIPFVIDSIPENSPNYGSGLKKNDHIFAFGDRNFDYVQDSRSILDSLRSSVAEASLLRSADTLGIPVQIDSLGHIGVSLFIPGIKVKHYNVLTAIPAGIKLTGEVLSGYLKDLKLLATPSTGAYKSVGSFIAIGQVFPSAWDWYQFMYILALLSVMLGVMNLLPIPGLDGGHILFLIYEMLTGRKPSDRFLYIAQLIGMALLFALMILAFGNDIGRLIH